MPSMPSVPQITLGQGAQPITGLPSTVLQPAPVQQPGAAGPLQNGPLQSPVGPDGTHSSVIGASFPAGPPGTGGPGPSARVSDCGGPTTTTGPQLAAGSFLAPQRPTPENATGGAPVNVPQKSGVRIIFFLYYMIFI